MTAGLTSEQLPLIPPGEIDDGVLAWDLSPGEGEYTGERLRVRNPAKYEQIVLMLASAQSVRYICASLSVHHKTVAAVRSNDSAAIATLKEQLGGRARDVARLGVEYLEDLFNDPTRMHDEKVSAKDVAVIVGIMVDKSELLTGGATSRVESTEGGPGHAELLAYLAMLRTSAGSRAMGIDGESSGQRDVTSEVEVGERSPDGATYQAAVPTLPPGHQEGDD